VDPLTNDVLKEGDVFTWPTLATTLQKIAEGGAKEFYSGSVANDLIEDLEQVGSIITLDDLKNYR
jgi:gamma-glutamyltranspeptidase